MIVMGSRPSPFVRKVLVFAHAKGIAVEVKPGGFGRGGEAFATASPFGKIPALQDGDFFISDSTAIITYMDAIRPDPNLIPTEPKARARTIWYEEFADTIAQPAGVEIFFNRVVAPFMGATGDAAAADRAETEKMPSLYDYLERMLPESAGYLVEDRFTLADIAVACPLINIAYCSSDIEKGTWPKVKAWLEAVRAQPSFAAVLEEEAEAMRQMMPA
ncbi:MAG: glutathione S-transferase family protein [Sphingobium sp.]